MVQATDDDVLPEYSTTVYRIVDGDPQGSFSVNSTTGLLSVTGPLDYETIPRGWNATYTLTLMAEDRQRPSLYDTTTVTIHLTVITTISAAL